MLFTRRRALTASAAFAGIARQLLGGKHTVGQGFERELLETMGFAAKEAYIDIALDAEPYDPAKVTTAINGFQAEGEAAKIVRGVPTVGRIANGAIIEREIDFALNRLNQVRLALRNADFTTAKRIAAAINDFIGANTAEPLDQSTVSVNVPKQYAGNVVSLLTEIEQLQIEPDLAAKIVIDERSGIIVMGRDVRVSTVAVAQGNLTVTISETPQVSQPAPCTYAPSICPMLMPGLMELPASCKISARKITSRVWMRS